MTPHSLYLIWHMRASGHLDLEARVQPDGDPPPYDLVRDGEQTPDGVPRCQRAARGLPESVCAAMARGYIVLMEETARFGAPAAMPAEHAAAILAALASGTPRRRTRQVVSALGYGGGSRDLDLAIGTALRDLGGWPPAAR